MVNLPIHNNVSRDSTRVNTNSAYSVRRVDNTRLKDSIVNTILYSVKDKSYII